MYFYVICLVFEMRLFFLLILLFAVGHVTPVEAKKSGGKVLGGKNYHPLYVPYYSGTCKNENGDVYLNEALFVNNEIVKIRLDAGYALLKIVRDFIDIEIYNNESNLLESYRRDVKESISKKSKKLSGIDIKLSFVWVDNSFGVYWKESYLNKPYLQGVFKLRDFQLDWFCQGSGGFKTSH